MCMARFHSYSDGIRPHACVHIYVYIYIYIVIYVYVHICISTCVPRLIPFIYVSIKNMHTWVFIYVCLHLNTHYVCIVIYVYVHICISTCVPRMKPFIYVSIKKYIHGYSYMCAISKYIYIQSHINTYTCTYVCLD